MFLFKDALFNTYCQSVNIELMADRTITHARRQLILHTFFPCKVCLILLAPRNSKRYICRSFYLQVKSPTKIIKMQTHGTQQTVKRKLIYSARAKARRQRVALFHLNWEHAHQMTQNFHCSTHACE